MKIRPFRFEWWATRFHKHIHAAVLSRTTDQQGIQRVSLSVINDDDIVVLDPHTEYITILTDRDLNQLWSNNET